MEDRILINNHKIIIKQENALLNTIYDYDYIIIYKSSKPSIIEINKLYWGIYGAQTKIYPFNKVSYHNNIECEKNVIEIKNDSSFYILKNDINLKENLSSLKNTNVEKTMVVWNRGFSYNHNIEYNYITKSNRIISSNHSKYILDNYSIFCIKKLMIYLNNNYKYAVYGGGVIGYLRNKKLIPWDDDIDICIKESEFNKLKNDKNIENETGWRFGFWDKSEHFYRLFVPTYFMNITFGPNNKYRNHVWMLDIMLVSENKDSSFISIGEKGNFWNKKKITKDMIFPSKKVKISDTEMYIPNDAKQMCKNGYGENFINDIFVQNHKGGKSYKITDKSYQEVCNDYIDDTIKDMEFIDFNFISKEKINIYEDIVIVQDNNDSLNIDFQDNKLYIITSTNKNISEEMILKLKTYDYYFLNDFLPTHQFYNFISYLIVVNKTKNINIYYSVVFSEFIFDLKNDFNINIKVVLNKNDKNTRIGYENLSSLKLRLSFADDILLE